MPLPQRSATTSTDVEPFYGYVDTTEDALRLIEAARRGVLPRVTRRLNELERRSMIKSGAVFVFSVEESGIKRWTEGLAWSQSRISGNFLIYREVTDRSGLRASRQSPETAEPSQGGQPIEGHVMLKPNGLIKKTITVKINGSDHHLISYFTQDDVRSGRLHRPTSRPDLMMLKLPTELLQSANFRYPLKLETQYATVPSHVDDTDGVDNHRRGTLSPIHPTRTFGRPSYLGAHTGSAHTPLDLSDFTRAPPDPPTSPIAVQGRSDRFDTMYPRFQTEIAHPISPTDSTHTGHSSYNTVESPVLDDLASSSWSSIYSCAPEPQPAPSSASAMYPPQLPVGHFDSTHLQRDGTWTQHAPSNMRLGRTYEPNVPRLDIGAHAEPFAWSQGGLSPAAPHQYASAPPTSTSISAQFPAVRGRDHARTRSVPPAWSWGQDPLYQPASHPIYASHGMRNSPP